MSRSGALPQAKSFSPCVVKMLVRTIRNVPWRTREVSMTGRLRAWLGVLALLFAGLMGGLPAPPASAASLVQITNFGHNPTNLGMYLYVPARVAARPAVVVAVHYCTGSGPAYYSGTQYAALADQYGYI